mmetsp:Transcript_38805/g.89792  ORF Transcript_38805/g.89792 Transcript_38805/m.89792 type:complete len:94 (-) Transcript_38805:1776-2057(-)
MPACVHIPRKHQIVLSLTHAQRSPQVPGLKVRREFQRMRESFHFCTSRLSRTVSRSYNRSAGASSKRYNLSKACIHWRNLIRAASGIHTSRLF